MKSRTTFPSCRDQRWPMLDAKPVNPGGMFAFAFEPQQITLDKEYARHVMSVLYQQVAASQKQHRSNHD